MANNARVQESVEVESKPQPEQQVNVEEIRTIIRALNKGIVVDILEVDNVGERESCVIIKAKILNRIDGIQAFGEVKLRFPKQALLKLKGLLGKID